MLNDHCIVSKTFTNLQNIFLNFNKLFKLSFQFHIIFTKFITIYPFSCYS